VLLAFALLVVAGSHGLRPRVEVECSVEPVVFSFEQVDRQAIRMLIDEHRGDTDHQWRAQVSDAIYDEAMAVGIDPLLVAAIVARESSFRDRVVSHAGAVGLMQLRPFVARDLARKSDLEWQGHETLHSPELNVRLGASYYRELVQRFDGDALLALAAYHRGPTRLRRQLNRGTFSGSRYASRVLELYEFLSAGRGDLLVSQG
jgi:soluble lytic murein transglycosylase